MAEVEDPRALLVMAVQDLFDAETAMVERLPHVRGHVRDDELQRVIARDEDHSQRQCDALAAIARTLGAEPQGTRNIWLRAILDDADNDARTIAAGPLRDVALTGALRKGKQSERVSYETARALAVRLGMEREAATLGAMRDAETATDTALAQVLEHLCARV